MVAGIAEGDDAVPADSTVGGLEADDAVEGGRAADGAAGVGAVGCGAEASSNGGSGAATGAASVVGEIPGIVGGVKEGGLGAAGGKFAHGELTEVNGAGLAQAGSDGGVDFGESLFVDLRLGGGSDTFDIKEVFVGDGDAVEGAAVSAMKNFGLGDAGFGESLFREEDCVEVKLGVEAADSVQIGAGEVDGGEVAALDEAGCLMDGEVAEILGHGRGSPPWSWDRTWE